MNRNPATSSTYSWLEYVTANRITIFSHFLCKSVPFFTHFVSSIRPQNRQVTWTFWRGYNITVIYTNQCLMDKIIGDNSAKSREGNPHLRQANTPVNKIPQKWRRKKKQEVKPWIDIIQSCPRAYWRYPLLFTGTGGGLYSMFLPLFRATRFAQQLPGALLFVRPGGVWQSCSSSNATLLLDVLIFL